MGPSSKKPNILILMPDQMRADCINTAGNTFIQTPNIDRLCKEGVRFENCYSSNPVCVPARASFLNGLYSHNNMVWCNKGGVQPDDDSFFRRLQEAGYYTAHIGKSHYYGHGGFHMKDKEPFMKSLGFDYVHEVPGPLASANTRSYMSDAWGEELFKKFGEDYKKRRECDEVAVWAGPLPEELFHDSYVGAETEKFIENYKEDKPFCVFIGFPGPHPPYDAPGRWAEMYDPKDMPEAKPAESAETHIPVLYGGGGASLSAGNIARFRANYYGKISLVDDRVGKIIKACDDKGVWENTLVIFWSDHGQMLGDHGSIGKSQLYEESANVLFFIRWPGQVQAGEVSKALVSQIDVFPTVCAAGGADPGGMCQGANLLPLLKGGTDRVRDVVISENGRRDNQKFMLRDERHKIEVHKSGETRMLFDLQEDPEEMQNLVGKADEIEKMMREKLFKELLRLQASF